ncbi:MAG: SDR family oxidoreductase [Anaerolineae bacterium]|nr:SDR family oxidoreductase [Thermoflexales bacterium]MDW8407205.1 SDR family oxidoreductase [Anaerolineae bacterium]
MRTWMIGLGVGFGAALAVWTSRKQNSGVYRQSNGEEWAVITGASAGIGAAFARHLAADGYRLLLIARRRERLEHVANELSRRHGVEVEMLQADLTQENDIERAVQVIGELNPLALLVNNAGFGTSGAFVDNTATSQAQMVRLHAEAPIRLTRAALPGMIARRHGAIINVASTAAFYALAGNATYCASKRFLITFSEVLGVELSKQRVAVQALCPGFTRTEFHTSEMFRASGKQLPDIPDFLWMSGEDVVACSLRELGRSTICIPGRLNKLIARLPAVLPSAVIAKAGGKLAGGDNFGM